MNSNELIQRYLVGVATVDEVEELEHRLRADRKLGNKLVLHAELDAHLLQMAQTGAASGPPIASVQKQSQTLWKWVSGISTLAATILLAVVLFNFPPQRSALAFASLGDFSIQFPLAKSIWFAAGTGDMEMLDDEIRGGVSVDAKLFNELTPLHVAALFGQADASERLLNEGAAIEIADGEGNTALHMAAFLGNTSIVKQLLDVGADPMLRNEIGFSAVDLAASPWNTELEEYMIALADRLQTNFDLEQIRKRRPAALKLLVNASDSVKGAAPDIDLFDAVLVGNLPAVQQHVLAGTDLNQKESFGGNTPLILATIFGKTEIASTLIEADVDLNLQSKSGATALHQACFFCRPEIFESLLTAGADPTKTNGQGLTPLDTAEMDFDADLISAYQLVYESLGLDFDVDDIAAGRAQIQEKIKQEFK